MNLEEIYVKPQDIKGLCRYDSKAHRWVLDISVLKPMFPDAMSDEELERKCYRYSRHVYEYLWNRIVPTYNKSLIEWLISCTEEGRDAMLSALKEQAEADSESGLDSLGMSSPVDLTNGTVIDPTLMKEASIAPYAKDALDDASVAMGKLRVWFNKRVCYGIRFDREAYERWAY